MFELIKKYVMYIIIIIGLSLVLKNIVGKVSQTEPNNEQEGITCYELIVNYMELYGWAYSGEGDIFIKIHRYAEDTIIDEWAITTDIVHIGYGPYLYLNENDNAIYIDNDFSVNVFNENKDNIFWNDLKTAVTRLHTYINGAGCPIEYGSDVDILNDYKKVYAK